MLDIMYLFSLVYRNKKLTTVRSNHIDKLKNHNKIKKKKENTLSGLPMPSPDPQNTVSFNLCVPQNILRDTPSLTYVQSKVIITLKIKIHLEN